MRTIDILVPVLNRPERVRPLIENVAEATVHPWRLIFLTTPGDDAECDAIFAAVAEYQSNIGLWNVAGDHGQYARKINQGATIGNGEFVFMGADDLLFHRGWDEQAIRVHEDTGAPVVGTNDLGNPTVMRGLHSTHTLVHRSYLEQGTIDEPGKLLHEGYGHQWVDTEFCDTAKKRRAWQFASESHVEHLHPFWKKGTMDAVYEKGQLSSRADMMLYRKRRRLWR